MNPNIPWINLAPPHDYHQRRRFFTIQGMERDLRALRRDLARDDINPGHRQKTVQDLHDLERRILDEKTDYVGKSPK